MTLDYLKFIYEEKKNYCERLIRVEKERIKSSCENNTAYPTYDYMVALENKKLIEGFLYNLNNLDLTKKDLKANRTQNKKKLKDLKKDLKKWRKRFKDLPN